MKRLHLVAPRLWFLMNFLIFIATQAGLTDYSTEQPYETNLVIFVGRVLIYVLGLGQLLLHHMRLATIARGGALNAWFRVNFG